jgi:hypothetical protein
MVPETEQAYEVAGEGVLWEAFEDEVVVINLDNGTYYALDAMGGAVFDLLAGGHATGAVVDGLARTYDGDRDVMRSEVEAFAGRLVEAGVLRARDGAAPAPAVAADAPAAKAPFRAPQLRAYTDMQDLLMIDPIHDVDETGWPVRRDPGGD